jgi:hypothetical protein
MHRYPSLKTPLNLHFFFYIFFISILFIPLKLMELSWSN